MSLPVIYTDHLVLRPCEEKDTDALHRLWADPDVGRYLFDDFVISFDKASEIVSTSVDSSLTAGLGLWAICRHASAPLLGFCGFCRCGQTSDVELLYGLAPQCWGQGLATQACQAALSYFWTTNISPRVYARTDPPNHKSIAVMERLGMCCLDMQPGPLGQPLLRYAIDRPRHFVS